jgi:hypothetical protein
MNRTQIRPGSGTIAVTPADLLRAAADYLDTHGWHQGAYYDLGDDPLTPPACVAGAIRISYAGQPVGAADTPDLVDPRHHVRDAIAQLADHLDSAGGLAGLRRITYPDRAVVDELYVGGWNDDPDRTITQVTTALRHAADQWDRTHHTGAAP